MVQGLVFIVLHVNKYTHTLNTRWILYGEKRLRSPNKRSPGGEGRVERPI